MSWWAALPGALALAVIWVVPGWAVLRAAGVRGLTGLGAGPATTSALVGLLAVAYDAVGLRWSLASMLAGFVVSVAVATIAAWTLRGAARALRTHTRPGMELPLPPPLGRTEAAALAAALAVAVVLIAGPMVAGMGAPDRPEQAWDAVFHLNAVALVRDGGNASTLGALGPLYGGGSPYYPTVWHAVAAVAPGLTAVPAAANVQNLVLAAVVWPLGMATLTRAAVRPGTASLLAPVLAAAFVAFPTVVFTVLAPWPFGLSVAVLPGALAALLVALRTPWRWRPKTAAAAGGLLTLGGVVAAHGSGAFSAMALAGLMVIVVLGRQARHWWQAGRAPVIVAAAAIGVALLIAAAAAVGGLPALRGTLGFERAGAESYRPALGKILRDAPLVYSYDGGGRTHLIVIALVVVGAIACLVRRRSRWLVVAWIGAVLLVLLAAGPEEHPLRPLTGFWYTQAARIAPLAVIPAVVLAALGAEAVTTPVAGWLRRHVPLRRRAVLLRRPGGWASAVPLVVPLALVLAVVAATGGLRWDLKERVTASVYTPGEIAWGTMLSRAELAMIERLPAELPPDAVVLGDPFNGSAYLPALAGVDVVFPQLGPVRGDDARLLERSLADLGTDPAVCAAARSLGVTHLYADTAGAAEGAKVHERTAAMREIGAAAGLELVDTGGTATVWRLTGC